MTVTAMIGRKGETGESEAYRLHVQEHVVIHIRQEHSMREKTFIETGSGVMADKLWVCHSGRGKLEEV